MASSGGKRFILRVRPSHTYLLEGDADILSRLLTFEVPSARFSPRFQRREWDGCVKFFERGQARFPTGMLPRVLQGLRMWGHKVAVRRKAYPKPFDPTPQDMLFGIDLRKDQLQCIDQALGKRMGLIDSPTGSGKTAIMAAIAGRLFRERSLTSIILVPGKDLLYQTHEEMEALLGEDITFGILGDSKRSFGNITIATPNTLARALPNKHKDKRVIRRQDPELRDLLKTAGALLVDEGHHAKAKTWTDLAMASPAQFKLGFSGTPLTGQEIEDARREAAMGPVIARVKAMKLVDSGYLANPNILYITDRKVVGRRVDTGVYKDDHEQAIIHDDTYNHTIALVAKHCTEEWGLPTIILAVRKDHIRNLSKYLEHEDVSFTMVWGASSSKRRIAAKNDLASGACKCVLASKIFDEAQNMPSVYCVIIADGGKAFVATNQRIGRGMRKKSGLNAVLVLEFLHSHNHYCLKHDLERLAIYEERGYSIQDVASLKRFFSAPLSEYLHESAGVSGREGLSKKRRKRRKAET